MLFPFPVRAENGRLAKGLKRIRRFLASSVLVYAMVDMKKWESKKIGVVIEADYEKCKGYGECVLACPSSVYELVDGKTTAPNIDDCIQCCACQDACPTKAIRHHSCQ
jgi:NAD-dependent dihydropyrimidine dehydrogenase PreA subunit